MNIEIYDNVSIYLFFREISYTFTKYIEWFIRTKTGVGPYYVRKLMVGESQMFNGKLNETYYFVLTNVGVNVS